MDTAEDALFEAVDRYRASAESWAERAGSDPEELRRRRVLARSHGQRVLRRLRGELQSVHASFDRAAATAPDIFLAGPAHELWQSVGVVLAGVLRAQPAPEEVGRIREILLALETDLGNRLG